MGFRITTWNVNGIRNPFGYQPWREKRTFEAMFDILEADIVIMQETKIQKKDLSDDMVLVPGWDVFFSLPRQKKGYSGVAVYTRTATCAPIRAEEGITGCLSAPRSKTSFRDLPADQQIGGYPSPGQLRGRIDEATLDSEGRCVIVEFPAFVLLGVYSPANRDETRVDFRIEYLEALETRIRNLVSLGKQVILTGDLNVLGAAIDTSTTPEALKKDGITMEEWLDSPSRRLFNQLLFERQVKGDRDEGREKPVLWDLCRLFHPTREGMNTCWDTKKNTRPANFGSRIDYILCTDGLKNWFTHADIQEGLMGSDHCPVYAVMAHSRESNGTQEYIHDVVNPPNMFKHGERQHEWSSAHALPLSARLMPEFDRRRNIRDMFFKQSSQASQPALSPPKNQGSPSKTDDPSLHRQAAAPTLGSEDSRVAHAVSEQPSGFSKQAFEKNAMENSTSKRRVGDSNGLAKSKRPRLAPENSATPKSKAASGQMTLRGFFKAAANDGTKSSMARPVDQPKRSTPPPPASLTKTPNTAATSPARTTSGEAVPSSNSPSTPALTQLNSTRPPSPRTFDPIEAKESWSKLLGKRVVPRCEHGEPCISLVTKKPGVNCGRSFYICGRPLGPSGEKEKESEWRCGTFIWSSDWGRNVATQGNSS